MKNDNGIKKKVTTNTEMKTIMTKEEEIKRLKNEIQVLKKQLATSEQYREILKKAAAYFAVQTL